MKSKEFVYIVLVKAHTGLGSIARAITGYEYTHIAVCLEEELEDFVTFSRRAHYAPFDSGFMHETLDCYAFGKHNSVKLKVFRLPVDSVHKSRILEYIRRIENDTEYVFNLYSMATMPLLHGFRIYKALNCMSFCARVIELSGAVKLKKKYYRYSIKDMDELLTPFLLSEKLFYRKKIQNPHYMDPVGPVTNMFLFLKLNGKLIYRLIFRKWMRNDE